MARNAGSVVADDGPGVALDHDHDGFHGGQVVQFVRLAVLVEQAEIVDAIAGGGGLRGSGRKRDDEQ